MPSYNYEYTPRCVLYTVYGNLLYEFKCLLAVSTIYIYSLIIYQYMNTIFSSGSIQDIFKIDTLIEHCFVNTILVNDLKDLASHF